MTESTEPMADLVVKLENIEHEISLIDKAIVLAQQSGADWSSERSKFSQLNSQYNEILDEIKDVIANREKLNVEASEGVVVTKSYYLNKLLEAIIIHKNIQF